MFMSCFYRYLTDIDLNIGIEIINTVTRCKLTHTHTHTPCSWLFYMNLSYRHCFPNIFVFICALNMCFYIGQITTFVSSLTASHQALCLQFQLQPVHQYTTLDPFHVVFIFNLGKLFDILTVISVLFYLFQHKLVFHFDSSLNRNETLKES